MSKNDLNVTLKGIDELLFSTEEQRQEEKREQVQQIPIDELHPFTNHPFKVLDDDSMKQAVESIKQYGVLSPLIARPRPDAFNAAFKEYSASILSKAKKPSVLEKLHELAQAAAELPGKVRNKEQERGL